MGLHDYQLPTERVDIDAKNHFTVRGVSFEDITKLVNKHGPVCVLIYTKFTESKGKHGLRPETIGQLISLAMGQFPDAVAEMIAIAAEEPETVSTVQRLPLGIQLDAIEKIVRLTFTGEADVKKLVETVTRMAGAVAANIDALNAPTTSDSGSGGFVSR